MAGDKILVTGANGFVGRHMVRELLPRGFEVVCFLWDQDGQRPFDGLDVELRWGDLRNRDSLVRALAGTQVVIHLGAAVSVPDPRINHEVNVVGTRNLMEACAINGVERVIAYSSVSAKRHQAGAYAQSKKQSEAILFDGPAGVTVFRPDIIFGNGSGGLRKIIGQIRAYPLVIPMVGNGAILRQPVYVRDIVRLTADTIDIPRSFGKAYDVGGPSKIAFRDFVLMVAEEIGVRKKLLPIPKWMAMGVARSLEKFSSHPTFTSDNVLGLIEPTDFDSTATMEELGFKPTALRTGLKRAIHELTENIT